jgi:hypothetical protein
MRWSAAGAVASLAILMATSAPAGAVPPDPFAVRAVIEAGAGDPAEDGDRDGIPDDLEIAWGWSDPRRADTDQDGIPDGAEDTDGDGVSAAGEARVGTDPQRVDSDADGVDDWHDDADGDGRADGPRQDARPIPKGLRPSLAGAAKDRPRSYRDGCHQNTGVTPIVCAYGATTAGAPTMVLFGDSHAAQWLPALDIIGRRAGWRLISITRSSCPAVRITIIARTNPKLGPICDAWRRRAVDIIGKVRPELVIVANFIGYDIVGIPDRKSRERRQAWQDGWRWTFRRLGEHAGRVVLLGETPHFDTPAVPCLERHPRDISRCSTPRRWAVHGTWDAWEARIAAASGVEFVTTTSLVCPYDPCPVIIGDRLLVFDDGHLNATNGPALALGLRWRLREFAPAP